MGFGHVGRRAIFRESAHRFDVARFHRVDQSGVGFAGAHDKSEGEQGGFLHYEKRPSIMPAPSP